MNRKAIMMIDDRINYISEHYGIMNQLEQTVEECAELIQAIQKYKRYKSSTMIDKLALNVNEEVADVLIMANQLRHLMGEDFIDSIVNAKLERQIERIAKGGYDGKAE